MDIDFIKGILMGVALGDALGAPHEFRNNNGLEYTGKLIHEIVHKDRFKGDKVLPIGTITDDTEMTLTLANQIIIDNGYVKDNIIFAYQRWAANAKMMGKNTRALFKGVKTIKGYQNRHNKIFSGPMEEWTQSNGSLMRCSPLIIFKDFENIKIHADLTNPHPNNLQCNIIYLYIMKVLIFTKTVPDINSLFKYTRSDDIKAVLTDVKDKVVRDIAQRR